MLLKASRHEIHDYPPVAGAPSLERDAETPQHPGLDGRFLRAVRLRHLSRHEPPTKTPTPQFNPLLTNTMHRIPATSQTRPTRADPTLLHPR